MSREEDGVIGGSRLGPVTVFLVFLPEQTLDKGLNSIDLVQVSIR